jgi:hypothetical protein
MTAEEVNKMVRIKEGNLSYIQDTFGIWGYPFSSERDSLNYWRDVQAGRQPRPTITEIEAERLKER